MTPARAAPGGAATITFGNADPKESFDERAASRSAVGETPEAVPRFPHAPGGVTTVCLSAATTEAASATRGPVGGADTVTLGADDPKESFSERDRQREGVVETPDAALRFPQAPGGASTLALGGAPTEVAAVRGPIAGETTVCLGTDDVREAFARRKEEREAPVATPEAPARFPQAPGGVATVRLEAVAEEAAAGEPRGGPVGGAATIVLGGDDPKEAYQGREGLRVTGVDTPDAAQRFPQAPGGAASIRLDDGAGGGAAVEATPTKGPVGGAATVVLGETPAGEVFAERQELLGAAAARVEAEAPDALPRFPHAPGGASALQLGDGEASAEGAGAAAPAPGPPVGGVDSVPLGGEDPRRVFAERQSLREATVDTPDPKSRFSQAPGGASSMFLGASEPPPAATKGPVGGSTTIALTDDVPADLLAVAATKGPVGGSTTVCLGSMAPHEAFSQHEQLRRADVDTPAAAPRFQQAPGGDSSMRLDGNGTLEASPSRGPVGGPASVVLGSAAPTQVFGERALERGLTFATPDAKLRFPQAPGGASALALGAAEGAEANPERSEGVPVGGPTTVVLGLDDAAEAFIRPKNLFVDPPEAMMRFPQAPGGAASICLAGGSCDPWAAGGPIGGQDTVVLGNEEHAAVFERYQEVSAATPDATPRFPQAPGGTSTVVLGGDSGEVVKSTARNHGPGGPSSLCLGGDYPHDPAERVGTAYAPAARQFQQAPGGSSTLCLGDEDNAGTRTAEAVSANRFANGSRQNCGNTITDRPTTRLHHAPGGASTLKLGGNYPDDVVADKAVAAGASRQEAVVAAAAATPTPTRNERVSPNRFASNSNQHSGNTSTYRPATRIHYAPGGASTFSLGGGDAKDPNEKVSANHFASGSNQNSGNTITDRSTTRLLQTPGGTSTLSLGESASASETASAGLVLG